MNKIRFAANKETNYIYHMLSVSKCGYDNIYGETYRPIYPAADLAILKSNESLLTVCGGTHCGNLYSLLICEPACAKETVKHYFSALIKKIEENKIDEEYIPYKEIIISISRIMMKHYDYYVENIWNREKEKIEQFIPQVLPFFEQSDFTAKAEEFVGCELKYPFFTATLVTSVENGAEAVDISEEQDMFGIERSPLDAIYFIGHEFIIYLLFHALSNENAFRNFETWPLTEGLAEFYLKKIMGNTRFFDSQTKYVDFYKKWEGKSNYSAVELYRMALTNFNI